MVPVVEEEVIVATVAGKEVVVLDAEEGMTNKTAPHLPAETVEATEEIAEAIEAIVVATVEAAETPRFVAALAAAAVGVEEDRLIGLSGKISHIHVWV